MVHLKQVNQLNNVTGKKRKDGVRQRYWKKTTRSKKVVKKGRYEFSGGGKELSKAVKQSMKLVPKGYIDIPARDFLRNMGWRELGLCQTSSLNSVIGFTDTETVLLDFDDTSFRMVRYWAWRAMKWFKLGGFIILKSSEGCYWSNPNFLFG